MLNDFSTGKRNWPYFEFVVDSVSNILWLHLGLPLNTALISLRSMVLVTLLSGTALA